MSKEAVKLALEAYELDQSTENHGALMQAVHDYLALAKQEQGEPVAVIGSDFQLLYCRNDWSKGLKVGDKLYTTPQQRTWVGLTDDEVVQIRDDMTLDIRSHVDFYRHCEAKLKEKNT